MGAGTTQHRDGGIGAVSGRVFRAAVAAALVLALVLANAEEASPTGPQAPPFVTTAAN